MQLSGGHLSREALRSLPGAADGLVRKYIDKKGRRRHAGIAAKLKSSQRLGLTVRDTQRLGLMILFNLICIYSQGAIQLSLDHALRMWH